MKIVTAAALACTLAACGSAAAGIPAADLGESARDAYNEANVVARGWSADASLRWIEGTSIAQNGFALPGTGAWRFHYTAPGHAAELLVQVSPLETSSDEHAITSPPGYVLGTNAVGAEWIDSPAALSAVQQHAPAAEGEASLLLVPTRPAQWIVQLPAGGTRWRVDAHTGELITQ